ncbi:hypothetical protein, partial [Klebsiella aerogenes]|uniref:hypothetical protein n=1 Tax=Klebsiella aerogenes TaxID=548 RepID=UPI001CBB75DE
GDERQAIAAGWTLAEMPVDQARREHHEWIIGAKRCDRFGNILRGDEGARADDHAGAALVFRRKP